jgi:hypothetical protein
MMRKGETKELNTLIIRGVSAAATPDGRVALVLDLKDRSIALEMSQPRLDDMRKHLAAIETFLHQKPGRA